MQTQIQEELQDQVDTQVDTQVSESIDHVSFRLLSEQDIQKLSMVEIRYQKPFVHGKIKEYGLHDLHMGATTQFDPCQTCHEGIETCNGHFGHITLTYPIYHALCFKNLVKVLNCICFSCFNLSIDIDQTSLTAQELKTKTKSKRKQRQDQFEDLGGMRDTLDFLSAQSKHKSKCEQCGFPKHKIDLRKLDLKIVWKPPPKSAHSTTPKPIFAHVADQAYATLLSNHFDAAFCLFCLRQLPKHLREWVLGPLDASCFILMNILVPPSITRPYTSQGKSMGVNELTSKLDEIVGANVSLFNQTHPVWLQFLHKILAIDFDCMRFPPDWVFFETWCEYNEIAPAVMNVLFQYSVDGVAWQRHSRSLCMRNYVLFWNMLRTGIMTSKWLEQYASLKYHGSVFLDNGLRMHKPEKKTVRTNAFAKGVVQRLKGKYGRFRWNLLGKRVNQCARSVVVPEAYLDIDELALPMFIARQLTIPETVQAYNRAKLQELVIRGSTKWPGSNSVVKVNSGSGMNGGDGATKEIELELLSRVEREVLAKELQPGDQVMRHLQDGDICLFNRQPSLHRPSIMGHRVRIINNGKGIGLHECVTHPYNADFDGDEMNVHQPQSLEARAEINEFMMVDKQFANHQNIGVIFGMKQNPLLALSLLSSPDVWLRRDEIMQYAALLNSVDIPEPAIQMKTEQWWTGRQVICLALPEDFEYTNGDVCIREKQWFGNGQLNKKHLGAGQGQLFHVLLHQLGSNVVKRVFSDLHRLGSEWLLHNGFSVGLSDCAPSTLVKRDQMLSVAEAALMKHETKVSEPKTSHFLNTLLSFTQPPTLSDNRIWTMVSCGSKGNLNNLTQIMYMLGQQTIDGKRIGKPFYPRLNTERTARHAGLVCHSYFEGLTTSEFYMHCAAGRKGLVDTAVSTASTGYSQRRVVKILESIFLTADGFVRTTDQQIVNVAYGIGNLDVSFLHSYQLKTRLELAPALWTSLMKSPHLARLNDVLQQQIFLGQNVLQSHSRHVHETVLKSLPVVIEIPFSIEHVWKQFLHNYAYDPNPQEMNFSRLFAQWDATDVHNRFFILKVLLVDWFGQIDLHTGHVKHVYRDDFVEYIKQLYEQKFVPAGEAVGGVAAESIGEPATQMTLNTFHYAGVSQQNVTNGIPRARELFFVQKQIKTPMILAHLLPTKTNNVNEMEHWCDTLTERKMNYFVRTMTSSEREREQEIVVEFHHERMLWHRVSPFSFAQLLRANINTIHVKLKIVDTKKKRQPVPTSISFRHSPTARVQLIVACRHPSASVSQDILQRIMQAMSTVWTMSGVCGVESAHAYQIQGTAAQDKDRLITITGTNDMTMHDIWDIYPIDFRRTFSNNIVEVEALLGIDASKYVLFKEMKAALSLEGTVVHDSHIRLLVDVMTCTGKLLPTDRNGLEEFAPDNILTRASFEKNTDVLRQASATYREQSLNGISEAIMIGSDLSLGTGASKMIACAPSTDNTTQHPTANAPSTLVTTTDWNMLTNWEPYFAQIDHIRNNLCLQCTSQQLQHPQKPISTLPETYLSRKRKQNDIQHVHYRPSSPRLLTLPALPGAHNMVKSGSGKEADDSSSKANNGSRVEQSGPSAVLTVDSLAAVMQSVTDLQSAATSKALGLMQSLLSQSLVAAFSDSDT